MIRKIVTVLILVPLALAIVMFAVANRAPVTLGFDPFGAEPPMFAFAVPLFLVLLVALIAGVIVGGAAAWSRQSKWRRRARRLSADLKAARGETETLRRQARSARRAVQPGRRIVDRRDRVSPSVGRMTCRCASSPPKRSPRPDLSGADRGAARGVPRRHHGAAAPPPPDRAARRAKRWCC